MLSSMTAFACALTTNVATVPDVLGEMRLPEFKLRAN
jgi:hypothetical protein